MASVLKSRSYEVDPADFMEFFYERGWTDGLPVVPPTANAIARFLDAVAAEPDDIIAEFPDRNRVVTAERVAINAVMAGCKPEYMPVIVTAVEVMAEPEFDFNHIACLSSTFPHFIINGPIVKELGMNTGVWPFGSGNRATSTISRALSLILWNCLEQKPGAVQGGAFGQPGRQSSIVIAENEEGPWDPLHVNLGYDRDVSTVTLISLYPSFGQALLTVPDPYYIANAMCELVFTSFQRAPYLIITPPPIVDVFVQAGWSKQDLRNYLLANTKYSVDYLKRSGRWGRAVRDFPGDRSDPREHEVKPGDENKYIYLFADDPGEYGPYVIAYSDINRGDVLIMVAGAGITFSIGWRHPHALGEKVTKPIRRNLR